MTDELRAAYESFNAALVHIGDSIAQALPAIMRMFDSIREIVADVVRTLVRVWRQWRAAHLVQRQYRNTNMRRKIRRYALMCERRQVSCH